VISSAFQADFRRQTQASSGKVLHKPVPVRFLAHVKQATMQSEHKSLIYLIILKMTGRIFRNEYIPEYAEQREKPSSSQSYPQK
jgi:hypothetical protein